MGSKESLDLEAANLIRTSDFLDSKERKDRSGAILKIQLVIWGTKDLKEANLTAGLDLSDSMENSDSLWASLTKRWGLLDCLVKMDRPAEVKRAELDFEDSKEN